MIAVTAKFQFYWTRKKNPKTHRSNKINANQTNGVHVFPKLFGVLTAKLFIHQQQQPFRPLGEKPPQPKLTKKLLSNM